MNIECNHCAIHNQISFKVFAPVVHDSDTDRMKRVAKYPWSTERSDHCEVEENQKKKSNQKSVISSNNSRKIANEKITNLNEQTTKKGSKVPSENDERKKCCENIYRKWSKEMRRINCMINMNALPIDTSLLQK